MKKIENGSFSSGSGSNFIERKKKQIDNEIEAGQRYAEELLNFPPTCIKSEDSFEPPLKKPQKLFDFKFNKVIKMKETMKVIEVNEVSEAERVYIVKKQLWRNITLYGNNRCIPFMLM